MPEQEYRDEFKRDITKQALAWDKAWEIRNFEIEMYWKRATYFWAFQVAVFAGYAAFQDIPKKKLGLLICYQILESLFLLLGFM